MPRAGVEPARPFYGKRRILSPQCLPISPSGPIDQALAASMPPSDLFGSAAHHNAGLWSRTWLEAAKKKGKPGLPFLKFGAGKESRTLDLNLGKVALYQLSYSRIFDRWPDDLLIVEIRRPPRTGAGKESRTLDLNLGKVALYQLSYSRIFTTLTEQLALFSVSSEASNYTYFLPASRQSTKVFVKLRSTIAGNRVARIPRYSALKQPPKPP